METTMFEVHEDSAQESIGERRLWMAVIVHAVQDWLSGSVRCQREAQRFLFEDNGDFPEVCARAGMDPSHLRSKLLRLGRRVEPHGPLGHSVAA
jgi:hypothetical protein